MFALLLKWDLAGRPPELLGELRRYITEESWDHYRSIDGLFQKVWLSRIDPDGFAAFYLWTSAEAREREIRRMHRVKQIIGVDASVEAWDVEAAQEGRHGPIDLTSIGKAWPAPAAPI
ncbi:hypothetical protein [Plastoroseomonas hellenica]|uniref:hypothetical protein n=1 Tax=Plastoroseomonas hellenica TaxID=2687306 RepID=UPI001BA965B7|nr:hypothetical protein [Plastoroseomonas hellenica]MBR0641696.1 hypothetical protein [Plastoroseomonas hellenica]